jgi:hypothetical protein
VRINISGSKAHRVWKCSASAVLPQIDTTEKSPMLGHGKVIHRFLERAKSVGRDVALSEIVDEKVRALCAVLDLDALPAHVATEVTFAWDWMTRTGRELGRNLDRRYVEPGFLESIGVAPLSRTEHAVTVDVLGGQTIAGVKRGLVGDYKTGRTRYPAPDKFGQTLLGALAAAKTHGFEEMFVDLIYIDSDGEHWRARRPLDEWDLESFSDEWAASMARVDEYEAIVNAGGTPNVIEGPHCAHCPAWKNCPAKLALASRLPVAIEEAADRTIAPMTVERAGAAWLALEKFEGMIDAMKEEIRGLAAREPIDLPDGRRIGVYHDEKRKVNARAAIPILREKFGAEAVERVVKPAITLEALRDLVASKRGPKDKLTTKNGDGLFDRMLRELEAKNALDITKSEYVKAFTPTKKQLARGGS